MQSSQHSQVSSNGSTHRPVAVYSVTEAVSVMYLNPTVVFCLFQGFFLVGVGVGAFPKGLTFSLSGGFVLN